MAPLGLAEGQQWAHFLSQLFFAASAHLEASSGSLHTTFIRTLLITTQVVIKAFGRRLDAVVNS